MPEMPSLGNVHFPADTARINWQLMATGLLIAQLSVSHSFPTEIV